MHRHSALDKMGFQFVGAIGHRESSFHQRLGRVGGPRLGQPAREHHPLARTRAGMTLHPVAGRAPRFRRAPRR